ncbi:unnamed protein product [Cochlearia groenlandica]
MQRPAIIRHTFSSSANINPEYHHYVAPGIDCQICCQYQAHENPIRSIIWSHNDNWMVSGDDGGTIKYWTSYMKHVKANETAHKKSIRDLSFCKTDLKFCSCSDDKTVKVWNFAKCEEELSLTGHGRDVKSVDWHPTKSVLVSGGKDKLVKLWDARTGKELYSFCDHKNTVLSVKWNQNGNWLLTASKDQIIKLYDIRTRKELESFRGHTNDVTSLAWHPFHEEYFASGSADGSIFHWIVGHENPQIEIPTAHDNCVWDLAWHPVGHILCSKSVTLMPLSKLERVITVHKDSFTLPNPVEIEINLHLLLNQGVFQGPPSSGGPHQMYPQGSDFNRPQMMPRFNNPYQQVLPKHSSTVVYYTSHSFTQICL